MWGKGMHFPSKILNLLQNSSLPASVLFTQFSSLSLFEYLHLSVLMHFHNMLLVAYVWYFTLLLSQIVFCLWVTLLIGTVKLHNMLTCVITMPWLASKSKSTRLVLEHKKRDSRSELRTFMSRLLLRPIYCLWETCLEDMSSAVSCFPKADM